jgi:methanogenic corrinoid protein MtbC1
MEFNVNTERNTDPQIIPRHSIAVVSRRTGITQLVLRAWERRYAAVTPSRTPTGRRKYTDHDVQKLTLLKYLTDAGHRIGDVAHLGLSELEGLYRDIQPTVGSPAVPVEDSGQPAAPAELLQEALVAVENLDSRDLEAVLNKALVDLSKPDLRKYLLVPLMQEIGSRWQDGKMRTSHEHMATSIVVAFLCSINSRYRVAPGAPVLAVATPAGQMHELGALLASSAAYEAGWDVLYLGADLPAEDIAAAVKSRGARALLLSLVFPQGDSGTMAELRELRSLVGPRLPIFAGGQGVPSYTVVLAEMGATAFSNVDKLDEALRHI